MRQVLVIMLSLLPCGAVAQDAPVKPSNAAQFAAQLAGLLLDAIADRDACRAQMAAKQPATPQPPEAKPQ